jgi:DNA-binding winged helix-turn-helix (wHTH) protein
VSCYSALREIGRYQKLTETVGKKGYFFRETLELLNRLSDVGDPF